MQDREHGAISDWIEKLVGVPRGCQRPGFRFAVADHHQADERRMIKGRAEAVREAVTELATLMD